MTAHPRSSALFGGRWPQNTAVIFNSTDDFFAAVLGPSQHDAHVVKHRQHAWLAAQNAAADAGDRRVQQYVNAIIARERASS